MTEFPQYRAVIDRLWFKIPGKDDVNIIDHEASTIIFNADECVIESSHRLDEDTDDRTYNPIRFQFDHSRYRCVVHIRGYGSPFRIKRDTVLNVNIGDYVTIQWFVLNGSVSEGTIRTPETRKTVAHERDNDMYLLLIFLFLILILVAAIYIYSRRNHS